MKFKLWIAMAAVMAALLLTANVALASVTFDSSTGFGFVGKGDVQIAFGWNNQTAQAQAGNLSFSYTVTESYTAVCEWTTGTGTRGQATHDINLQRTSSVSDTIQYDARAHNQVDGFFLTGFTGTPTYNGTVPVVGGACVGNTDGIDFNGTWTSVTDNGSSGGGLFVSDPTLGLGPVKIY